MTTGLHHPVESEGLLSSTPTKEFPKMIVGDVPLGVSLIQVLLVFVCVF